MPANLPPQYIEAEQRYREAKSNPEKLRALESMLALIPKHKGTEKLQGQIKKRIAKLKSASVKKQPVSRETELSYVKREGAGQLVLAGPPNVGKSSILKSMTSASPEIADYPFTTRKPLPGMVPFENIQLQLIDLPPLSRDFTEPWVFSIIRHADLLFVVVDLNEDSVYQMKQVLEILRDSRILLSETEQDVTLHFAKGKKPAVKKSLIVANKSDVEVAEISLELLKDAWEGRLPIVAVSVRDEATLNVLKETAFSLLDIIRVYSKMPGKSPDYYAPFVLKKESTIRDMARLVHKDFVEQLAFARVWRNEKFQGQRVHRDFVLQDGDVVELHL